MSATGSATRGPAGSGMRGPIALLLVLLALALGAVYLFRDALFPGAEPAPTPPRAEAPAAPAPPDAGHEEKLSTLEQEAEKFVEKLSEPEPEPVPVEEADHFVRPDQPLSLITRDSIEETTPRKLLEDPDIEKDTPITIVRKVEQIENKTPEKIIAEAGGDMEKKVKVLEGDEVREKTVREVLEQHAKTPEQPITVVEESEYLEKTTPEEIAKDESIGADTPIRVIKEPYALASATVEELLSTQEDVPADAVFYVRTVQPDDEQGIWGIIHHGLIENFAQGIAIRRGRKLDTYRVHIPRYADERLPDDSSSFLGRLLYEKSRETWVYNYRQGRLGQNPDLINPGQEIVIVTFKPEELIEIYKHFVGARPASG